MVHFNTLFHTSKDLLTSSILTNYHTISCIRPLWIRYGLITTFFGLSQASSTLWAYDKIYFGRLPGSRQSTCSLYCRFYWCRYLTTDSTFIPIKSLHFSYFRLMSSLKFSQTLSQLLSIVLQLFNTLCFTFTYKNSEYQLYIYICGR